MKIEKILSGLSLSVILLSFCSFCKPPQLSEIVAEHNLPAEAEKANAAVLILDPDTGNQRCGGVAVYGNDGVAVLMTAAHCVTHKDDPFDPAPNAERGASVGDRIRYVTRDSWYSSASGAFTAQLKELDQVRDRAVLSVNPNEVPTPLMKANLLVFSPEVGAHIHSIAPVFSWDRHDGMIEWFQYSGIGSYYIGSSVSINFGWSGSPVILDNGEVLGLEIKCYTEDSERKCIPGSSIITTLP